MNFVTYNQNFNLNFEVYLHYKLSFEEQTPENAYLFIKEIFLFIYVILGKAPFFYDN